MKTILGKSTPVCLIAGLLLILPQSLRAASLTLAANGQGMATIHAPRAVMAADQDTAGFKARELDAETDRRRLRESVKDLARYLGEMSGARVEVVTAPAGETAAPGAVRILVGDFAAARFGAPAKPFPYQQGFRVVVDAKGGWLGLIGESDLATSYAIYEVLDRLGCRWYMPGDHGEFIPRMPTIALDEMDFSSHPATIYRGIWYADDDYRRRNRYGGMALTAGHALELTGSYLTEEDKQKHPEWIASVGGKPMPTRLKWSNRELADSIADKIIARHASDPRPSYSLGPDDGAVFDDSAEDRALDANDFDTTFQTTSLTDRLMVLCNRITARVAAKDPDVLLGVLAYVQYTRPPLREKPNPNLVPQIAPITYSRAHPMNDDRVPGNRELRYIVEGWGKSARMTSYYFYGWFLAEPVAPNPMIRKWSHDVPYVLDKGNCKFWQPETTSNFETSMHAIYLGNRLSWDPSLKPEGIIAELNEKFYGGSASEMGAYWDFIDRVWVETDEYSGGAWGYLRRWTPENLHKARGLMNAALASARTPAERYRIGLADDSLSLFEAFMRLRYDLAEGRLGDLDQRAAAWMKRVVNLGETYKDCYAFTRVPWDKRTYAGGNFASFYLATYDDAARIARGFEVLTPAPLRRWRYLLDEKKKGEAAGYAAPELDDSGWRVTDVAAETWSTLGHHDYFGSVWYRAQFTLPAAPGASPDKRTFLWLSSTDGSAKVFVNGKHVPYTFKTPEGKAGTDEQADGFCKPFSFDITAALNPSGQNHVAVLCTRSAVAFNELGTGGLIGPVMVYRDR